MKYTFQEQKIIDIVEPAIIGLGYELVCIEFKGGILQISVENPKTNTIGVEDCTVITRVISPLLEVEDPIPGAYTLEIGSPGIDRPLIKGDDFNRYAGFEAKVELDEPTESGQRRYRGKVLGFQDGIVKMFVDNVEHSLDLNNIRKARLVLTDELIKATKKQVIIEEEQQPTENANEAI